MNTIEAQESVDHSRRRFLGATAMTAVALELGRSAPAMAASATTNPQNSFDALKQIDAGVLSVGYAEAGAADGAPVILLHGWPYDIHTYVDVAPILASNGYRVIVPYLRG